jgi:hypothetical protein
VPPTSKPARAERSRVKSRVRSRVHRPGDKYCVPVIL